MSDVCPSAVISCLTKSKASPVFAVLVENVLDHYRQIPKPLLSEVSIIGSLFPSLNSELCIYPDIILAKITSAQF